MIVGHKPSGDSPAVLASTYTGVEMISADTSYADSAAEASDGPGHTRGASLSGLSLHGPSLDVNSARVFGRLKDGREHDAWLPCLHRAGPSHDSPGDAAVGRELPNGWWCKAKLQEEPEAATRAPPTSRAPLASHTYHCCRGEGRRVEYRDVKLRSRRWMRVAAD